MPIPPRRSPRQPLAWAPFSSRSEQSNTGPADRRSQRRDDGAEAPSQSPDPLQQTGRGHRSGYADLAPAGTLAPCPPAIRRGRPGSSAVVFTNPPLSGLSRNCRTQTISNSETIVSASSFKPSRAAFCITLSDASMINGSNSAGSRCDPVPIMSCSSELISEISTKSAITPLTQITLIVCSEDRAAAAGAVVWKLTLNC